MADVRDIMELERPPTPEITRDTILGTDSKHKKRSLGAGNKPQKRPEGMHREVFALLYQDNQDVPPIFPSDTSNGYKQIKIKLGMRRPRKWKWMQFTNPARTDNATFYHWRRPSDEPRDYPFAKFNKKVDIVQYTDSEYQQYLKDDSNNSWSKEETDYIFDLARAFDLRFIIMADRYNVISFRKRSVEDIKERYYKVCEILAKLRGDRKIYVYDGDHERRRKEQLKRLYERTQEQIEEEQFLISEMKKIEARKKERERKTQDLQKLISQADSQSEMAQTPRRSDKKVAKKKLSNPARPSRSFDTTHMLQTIESAGIKFPDYKNSGVSLRSHRMKLPANVGQKKAKGIEQLLQDMNLDLNPTPTEETCQHFNELRSDLVLLMEIKTALATCEFELQSLRHQYEASCPGKTLTIPPQLFTGTADGGGDSSKHTEIIDVVGSPGTSNT